jgi:hypothetical protein
MGFIESNTLFPFQFETPHKSPHVNLELQRLPVPLFLLNIIVLNKVFPKTCRGREWHHKSFCKADPPNLLDAPWTRAVTADRPTVVKGGG